MKFFPRAQFLLSILTAMTVGVGVAYIGIIGFELVTGPQVALKTISKFTASLENPAFIKRFSRAITYSAKEIQEEVGDDITFTGLPLSVPYPVDPLGRAVSALAYSVQSLDKDNILIEKDSQKLLPIASVTKLITAVIAKKLFNDDDTVTITSKILATEGNTGRLRLGEKFKVKEIFYPLLLVSSNDAAEALAQTYDAAYGRGEFVREMNTWVNSIGAFRTSFRDVSGLSPLNLSTAHDLSVITKWIKENEPEIFDITLAKAKTIRTHTWINPTHFLNLASYSGGKNGFTTEARLTNISIFSLGSPKRLYSVVLLGSSQRDKDTLAVLNEAVK